MPVASGCPLLTTAAPGRWSDSSRVPSCRGHLVQSIRNICFQRICMLNFVFMIVSLGQPASSASGKEEYCCFCGEDACSCYVDENDHTYYVGACSDEQSVRAQGNPPECKDHCHRHWGHKEGTPQRPRCGHCLTIKTTIKYTVDLLRLANSASQSNDAMSCYFLALELVEHNLLEQASCVLTRHVDLDQGSQLTFLYLQTLAGSRRDTLFRNAIASLPGNVRQSTLLRWIVAKHAWNCGDLELAHTEVDLILAHDVNNARARLLKIEILLRQNRSADVFAQLDQPIEHLDWKDSDDHFRLASLLGNFGHHEPHESPHFKKGLISALFGPSTWDQGNENAAFGMTRRHQR